MFMSIDRTTKKLLLCFLSLLFAWWVLSASATCSASEPMYQITEQELTQLECNLSQLSSINTKLQLDLTKQRQKAEQLRQQLTTLQSQLEKLQQQSATQESSLMTANKLLEEYAIAEKKKRLKIKAQRNTYFVMMIAATAYAVCHR